MLAPPTTYRCIECGRASTDPLFHFHYGRVENGPAYFCDRGVMCSPDCSLAHTRRRIAEGTRPERPTESPGY